MKQVIDRDIELTQEASREVEFHSFVNVINVLTGELQILEEETGNPGLFDERRAFLGRMIERFREEDDVERLMNDLVAERTRTRTAVERLLSSDPLVAQSKRYIVRLFDVVDARVRDMLARVRRGDAWLHIDTFEIRHGLELVFEVIAERAGARFDVEFGPGSPSRPNAYRIDLACGDGDESTIFLPPVMIDVVRDLTANARKYTAPGGTIAVRLTQSDDAIELRVEDNGRGIPAAEIERVVDYGYRASNAGTEETMGRGFGLTKAYLTARRFGGEFWIESSTDADDHGTTVALRIPIPESLRDEARRTEEEYDGSDDL